MKELRHVPATPERSLGSGATRRWIVLLVAAALAGPVIVLLAQLAGYASAEPACVGSGLGRPGLHLVPLMALAITSIALAVARLTRRRAGRDWVPDAADPVSRDSMLATIGLVLGGFGSLVLLGFWLAIMLLHPCWGS